MSCLVPQICSRKERVLPNLPVTNGDGFVALKGNNAFIVKSAKSPNTWLSSRIKVEDKENRITIAKPKGRVN